MRDKQLERIGEILFPLANVLVLTSVENPRSASIETLRSIADRAARGKVVEARSSSEALEIARTNTPPEGLICIAGSLYLLGEVRPALMRTYLGNTI